MPAEVTPGHRSAIVAAEAAQTRDMIDRHATHRRGRFRRRSANRGLWAASDARVVHDPDAPLPLRPGEDPTAVGVAAHSNDGAPRMNAPR